jgi:hypothetical protein
MSAPPTQSHYIIIYHSQLISDQCDVKDKNIINSGISKH